MTEELTYLYRFYDRWFALLYVGITSGVPTRFESHAKSKDWWPDVRHIDIERYDSRSEAARAEREAITKEAPAYNVQHGTAPRRRPNQGAARAGITVPPARLTFLIGAWHLSYASCGRMFGVTRQAVSKWVHSGYPSGRLVDIEELALPTELLAHKVGLDRVPLLVRQVITIGDSILSVAEQGNLGRAKAMLNMRLMRAA